jgi:PPK2 family polyphosphate:nucleotide phosphotransferase
MKLATKRFRVRANRDVDLGRFPTRAKPLYASDKEYESLLAANVARIAKLQNFLFAEDRRALLVVFQGMDGAGKDSAIRHIFSGINPAGCQVFSFKQPSSEELDHDFLWRTNRCLPERGRIGVFNRSYYEEVIVVRVHPKLLDAQHLPPPSRKDESIWKHRYRSIVELEKHLHRNGTRVVKFFLHLSKDEQRQRFLARIDDPDKNWKFNHADVDERGFWKDYRKAYEACLSATSTDHAPWYVVPADDKPNARLIVSQVLVEVLEDLDLAYPKTTPAHRRELLAIRRRLAK